MVMICRVRSKIEQDNPTDNAEYYASTTFHNRNGEILCVCIISGGAYISDPIGRSQETLLGRLVYIFTGVQL